MQGPGHEHGYGSGLGVYRQVGGTAGEGHGMPCPYKRVALTKGGPMDWAVPLKSMALDNG